MMRNMNLHSAVKQALNERYWAPNQHGLEALKSRLTELSGQPVERTEPVLRRSNYPSLKVEFKSGAETVAVESPLPSTQHHNQERSR